MVTKQKLCLSCPLPFLFLIILPWLLSSCTEKPEEPRQLPEISRLAYGGRFLLSDRGDTIRTSIPIPMQSRRLHPDSLAKPKTFPLLRKPEVLSASSHPAIVDRPVRVPLPAKLTVIQPGKDGVPLPKQILVKSKVLSIRRLTPAPALPLGAKNDRSNWRTLDVEQGLNSSFIVDIFIDSRGYLWIGTSGGGVSRYDGSSFSHFTKEQGMTGNQTHVMLEDSRGHLWFSSHDHAVDTSTLIRYDGNDFRQFYGEEGLTSDWDYMTMFEDREGHLWIGTRRGGARLELAEDGISGILTPYTEKEGLPGKTVWSMTEDDEGCLWIGTFEGLGRFDPAVNEGWGSFTQFGAEEGLNSNFIQSVRNIGSNRIWLETNAGACLFDGFSFTQYNMRERYAYSFIPSRRSDTPRFASGDQLSNDFGNPFLNFPAGKGFSNVEGEPAMEDSFGNWWDGTEGFGVYKLNRKHNFVYIPEIEGLKTNCFTSVYPDSKGNIWIGTCGLGVVCYNPQGKGALTLYTEKEGLIDNDVQTIFEDKRGSIWIGTSTGVSRYDPAPEGGGGTLTNYGEAEGLRGIVTTIVEDGGGNLWFGGYGVYRYDPQQKEFTKLLGKAGYFVRDIIEDGQGQFWFASYGLYRYDPVNSTFTVYTEKEGLPSNQTMALVEDRRGRIWVGTSEGVCYFNGESFTTLPLKKGWWQYSFQAFGKFNSIVEDSLGRLWISRERAISVVVPQEKLNAQNLVEDSFQIFDFDKLDGIKATPFQVNTAGIDRHNRIWWAGINGLNVLDLNQFELPTKPPAVNLHNVDVNGQFVDYRQLSDTAYSHTLSFGKKLRHRFDSVATFYNYPLNLTLHHRLNHLTFHFTAIDWADPEAIQYSYQIEGLDEGWSAPSAETKAEYRNIPSGTHTLKLRAIGMAQVWSEPLSYTFTVLPPWWFTWWAWCLWIGMGAGLLYWFYRFQLSRRLAEAEAYRLRELDQVKNHLYTNITHEFRTPLTIINGVAGQLQSQASESVKRGLKMIVRNGRQLLRLVNQMLDLAKLQSGSLPVHLVQGDIILYLRYLTESFHSYAKSRNIDLHFQTDLAAYVMDYDQEKTLHIVSNLLSNAVKFTPANGAVYFRVAEIIQDNTSFLQVQVKDSGIGIAEEKLPHIFDRFYQVDTSATRSGELARMNIRSDGGTGIGLALTRELVHLLGGTIEVQSRLGEGSTFTVLLPAVRHGSTHAAPAGFEKLLPEIQSFSGGEAESYPKVATPAPQNGAERPLLLIIEDNADVVRFLASCLESSYQLAAAPNGQAGIEKALELTPDIIISDVMMPLKDGFEVCDTLKNDVRTSHIPIVLLTAKADVESRITGLRRGADAYLAKPFDKEELLVRLEQLIALRRRLLERYQHAAAVLERTGAEPSDDPSFELEDDFLQQVRDLIQENLADPDFGNEEICKALGLSRTQLFRKLKALTGMSVVTFIRFYRLNKARQLLIDTNLNISEVAYRVGFNDPSYFGRVFRREFGLTPMECRDKEQMF